MSGNRRVCIITGTRAEYGLLFWIMKEIEAATDLQLRIIVTGMHLSPEFGLTHEQIERDGFHVDRKVEMLLSSDTGVGVAKSMGLGMIGFADAFADLRPDLLLVLGDRFEIFSAVSAAMVSRIPVAHIHGGEVTEGAFDESIRHSITKMSHLHFTATEVYRSRVIQLGEQPSRVFNVGAPGVDNIKRLALLARDELEETIGFRFGKRNLLVTFHPATLDSSTAGEQFGALLRALDELEETHLIFTKANADCGGRVINRLIDDYVATRSEKAVAFTSMGQLNYLSAIQFVDAVVGNSSSGLIEAPSFRVATINIGDRQRGRIRAESVIDCEADYDSIHRAIRKIEEPEFKKKLRHVTNPYGDGEASRRIVNIIRDFPLEGILKKPFFDFGRTG